VRAGFGTSSITPPLPCRLAGYARRQALSRQVAQPLRARSIVLDNGRARVGWVICDLLEVSRSLVADVRAAVEATGCVAGANVMVSATHTHAGPDLNGDWDDEKGSYRDAQAQYRAFLPHAVASSMVCAVEDLAPSVLAWAEEPVYGVGAGRRATTAGAQRASVITARRDGRLAAVVIVHPCHGTVLGPNNLAVSGDLIGAGVEALEAGTGATGRCAWAQGAAGDISTRSSRRERSPREAERLGLIVATAAERAVGRAEPVPGEPSLELQRAVVSLPLKGPDQLAPYPGAPPPSRDEDDRSEAALREEAMVAQRARQDGTRPPEIEAEITVLRLGELSLCFVPGEPFESVERGIVARARQKNLRVVGYSNGAPGYVFGPDEEHEGGYEVMSSPLTGEAGARIVATGSRLAALQV
jgi:neutral ceramidase